MPLVVGTKVFPLSGRLTALRQVRFSIRSKRRFEQHPTPPLYVGIQRSNTMSLMKGILSMAAACLLVGCAGQRDQPQYNARSLYEYTLRYCQDVTRVDLSLTGQDDDAFLDKVFWEMPTQDISFDECMREHWIEPEDGEFAESKR